MPEGHSIHRIARRFNADFGGRPVEASSPQGRFADGAALISGTKLGEAYAVGKHLFLPFEGERTVRVHLGIYGAWDFAYAAGAEDRVGQDGTYSGSLGAPRRVRAAEVETSDELEASWPPEPVGQVRLRLMTDEVCADLRGPMVCEVLDPHEVEAQLAALGPDPLVDGAAAGGRRFAENVRRRRRPIGSLLMDQSVVAGIGNVYRAEMLFRAGLSPFAPGSELTDEQIAALWRDWVRLLPLGVEHGVMVTRTRLRGANRERALEDKELRHFVYGRQGQPCRVCSTPIAMQEMEGRKLYWCPHCQS